MATIKQKKAVEKIVENSGNVSKSMKQAGYSEITAKNPKHLTDSKGYLQLCEQYGLTDQLILESLVSDIKSKKKNRVQELNLAAKMKGHLIERIETETKSVNLNINLDAKTLKQIQELTKTLKKQI